MNLLLVYTGRAAKRMLGPQGKRKFGPPPPILQIIYIRTSIALIIRKAI
jgi:hypothetical protein